MSPIHFDNRVSKISKISGFTLIELMVTIAIFVFMTAVIMAKYNSFYSGTIFKNTAYDVALTIRQAQTYGISVKVANTSSSSDFNQSYGIRFQLNTDVVAKKFTLFSYKVASGLNFDESDIKVERVFNIKNGAKINELMISNDGGTTKIGKNFAAVVFKRPNPEAIVCAKNPDNYAATFDCSYNWLRVKVVAADTSISKYIYINSAGQIRISDI